MKIQWNEMKWKNEWKYQTFCFLKDFVLGENTSKCAPNLPYCWNQLDIYCMIILHVNSLHNLNESNWFELLDAVEGANV